jgi:hypothetical protein
MTVKRLELEKMKANQGYMIRLRKARRSLVTNGEGIIALGAWTVFRIIMSIVVDNPALTELLQSGMNGDTIFILIIGIVVFTIILGFIFALHWIAGMGAYKEGHGKKAGNFYLFTILVIIILPITDICMEFMPEFMGDEPAATRIMEIVIDVTLLLICVDTINDAYQIRHILKEFPDANSEAAV